MAKRKNAAAYQSDLGAMGTASLSRPAVIEKVADGMPGQVRRHFQDECLADRLLAAGWLGDGETGRRRHGAAMALRELHHAAGLSPKTIAVYGVLGRSNDEMSDHQAATRAHYNDVLRHLAGWADIAQDIAVYDVQPGIVRQRAAWHSFDLLADYLGLS